MAHQNLLIKEMMSICRTTIVELHTEEDTDAMIADYIENFDSMFPECELTLNSMVGPTKVISNSVYANQVAIEKTGSGSRQKFMDKHKDRMKEVTTFIGEVTFSK